MQISNLQKIDGCNVWLLCLFVHLSKPSKWIGLVAFHIPVWCALLEMNIGVPYFSVGSYHLKTCGRKMTKHSSLTRDGYRNDASGMFNMYLSGNIVANSSGIDYF